MTQCSCNILNCTCPKNDAKIVLLTTNKNPELVNEKRTDAYLKLHMISETHGFAVEKNQNRYLIAYVSRSKDEEGKECIVKEAQSYSNGKMHAYSSPFVADFVIRKEILPLYDKKGTAA